MGPAEAETRPTTIPVPITSSADVVFFPNEATERLLLEPVFTTEIIISQPMPDSDSTRMIFPELDSLESPGFSEPGLETSGLNVLHESSPAGNVMHVMQQELEQHPHQNDLHSFVPEVAETSMRNPEGNNAKGTLTKLL